MSGIVEKKLESIFRRLAAEFLVRESNRTSLLTVTRIEYKEKQNRVKIFLSVLPESKEQEAIDFVQRKKGEFAKYMKENSRLRSLPSFVFEIDIGDKNRIRIDELTRSQ